MKVKHIAGLAMLLLVSSAAACDRSAGRDDRPGQTTTTGASDEAARKADALGEKLDRAGDKAGEAAKKAAGDATQEAKREWNALDVHVQTGGAKDGARDGGMVLKTH